MLLVFTCRLLVCSGDIGSIDSLCYDLFHRDFVGCLFTNVFLDCSLSRLLTPLENVIKNELSKRESTLYEWYSSHQNPLMVRQFVNIFENDPMFNSATAM